MKPIILSEGRHTLEDLEKLERENKVWQRIDLYQEQLEELFIVENPSVKFDKDYETKLKAFIQEKNHSELTGAWVYYSWSGFLIHTLNEKDFEKVRTNRNKNIINLEEQSKLRDFSVGILGLSIGNGMAVNLAFSGISNYIKIADFDVLSLSNLNRIRSGIHKIGTEKWKITTEQIYEINPFAEVEVFDKGLNNQNVEEFLSGGKKLDLVFEAIDDFEMKIRIRMEAKKHKVPVIMLTNLGDRLMIDIERYDLDPHTEIFNGLIGSTAEEILSKPISESDKQKYAVAIVGRENIPSRVMETIGEINKTLVGRPQVMSTVTIGSGVASYLARQVALNHNLPNGRRIIRFEDLI